MNRWAMMWTLDKRFGTFMRIPDGHRVAFPKAEPVSAWSWVSAEPLLQESTLTVEYWRVERFVGRDGRRHWIVISPDALEMLFRQGYLDS